MNLIPIGLNNKSGTNMCWWNAFIQLFAATRNELIVNEMNKFINKHKCDDGKNKKCWNCNMFQTTLAIIIIMF
jgi:hypothetical protein